MILTVLRFQEPPRERDNCYLQPRDLPSQGVFPFVRGLLCNTGSRCRNTSYERSMEHHFRSSRLRSAAAPHRKVDDLAFLKEMQDLAKEVYEVMDEARNLQKLWVERSQTPDSSFGSSFITMDLNKTEEVLAKLESLHRQPHVWEFLLLLPRLRSDNDQSEDGIRGAEHLLQAAVNSFSSLEDLDWLPRSHTFARVSKMVLNVAISMLTFLQERQVATTESGYTLSLIELVWDPQKVRADLKSQFGFGDLHTDRILNYSAQLQEIPTDSSLERMVCSALSGSSEDEGDRGGHPGDCDPRWSAAKNYLVREVSQLHLYKQVFAQWRRGGLLQKALAGPSRGLEALRNQSAEGSPLWKVAEALHTAFLLLNDTLAASGPQGHHTSTRIFLHLQRLQRVVTSLPPGPALGSLLQLDGALRKVLARTSYFVQEVLVRLETSANGSNPGGPGQWKLEKAVLFGQLEQLLMKNATGLCLSGHLSEVGTLLRPGHPSVQEGLEGLEGLVCGHNSSREASALHKLLESVEDANRLLQEVVTGHTNTTVLEPEDSPGWQDLDTQLSAASLPCSRLLWLLGAEVSQGDCKDQLMSIVLFHTLKKVQLFLEQTPSWKAFLGFVRKTCELARFVNKQESFQDGLLDKSVTSPPAFSEESPCYEENMDWKIISDNYFAFLNNLLKTPKTSLSRLLNSTKELLMVEKKLQPLEDEQINLLLSFMEFLEKLLVPNPFDSSSVPKFHTLLSLPESILNISYLWIDHLTRLESDTAGVDTQKLLESGKEMIEKVQTLENLWRKKESRNSLRFLELLLYEMHPKLLELWIYDISARERAKLEVLSTLLNFSDPEDERILSKSFSFSQLFHSDGRQSPARKMDFVHLSEIVINSLHELGLLRQEQVSDAVGTVHALRNASKLFSALSEPQKKDIGKILTHVYLHVFQDKDSALFLQIYSSFYQYVYTFLSIQSRESLLPFLTQISEHILDITRQFNFQNISKAFAFFYETTEVLGGISQVPYCQQLLSIFNFLELQAQSLMSKEAPEMQGIHATLTGLKQLFATDADFRNSVFQYVSQLLHGSGEALLGNECFVLNNKSLPSVHYSVEKGSASRLPWAQMLSNLTAEGSAFPRFAAVHCTVSWLQMWTGICRSASQVFRLNLGVLTSLHVGLTQLLDELESAVPVPQTCRGRLPTHHPAGLILHLFRNVTQADGFHSWDDFLNLRGLWVALSDGLVRVKLLNLDHVEKSLLTMETALAQLKSFPLHTNGSREFLSSLLDVFIELSNTSAYIDRNVPLRNHFLSKDLTDYEVRFADVLANLRETISFLKNVSHDQDLLSCADIFQNVTEFILEGGLFYANTSQRAFHILAMLNSTFSSADTVSRLKGCSRWIDIITHLCRMLSNSSFSQGRLQGVVRRFRDAEDKMNSALKLVTWVLNVMMEPDCSLNTSNMNCVNSYLKNMTDFLNVILTAVLEKEEVPKFEILLTVLNDSTNQVRLIISNVTRDFDAAPQSNWKHFTELILKPTEMSAEMPLLFQNIWLHLVALGKKIQTLAKASSPPTLKNNTSSETEKILNAFATSPKEKEMHGLGDSFYQLASYLAFNLSHDPQSSPQITSPEIITKAVGLSIQLMRDAFNFLRPSVYHNIPQEPEKLQVLKTVTSLMHTLKNADIHLLAEQLGQVGEGLMNFFRNISRLGSGTLGVSFFVDLMEKFVDSSHSWNVNHLLRLSRLFPRGDVDTVVDLYYLLPHAVGLLQRVVDKNVTEALKDAYNFTLLHGISLSDVTKEDFAIVIKTLLDTTELISDNPEILPEALTCLPVFWCWNRTASGLQQHPKSEACNAHELTSLFYSKVAGILAHLHLSPLSEDSPCLNETSQREVSRKVACVVHELMDWMSILLELSEAFHVKTSLVETVQGFWYKALPFVLSSGNQSHGSISELCPGGPVKQVALQVIGKLKNVDLTKVTSDENLLNKLASLNKTLNVTEGAEAPVRNTSSLNLGRIIDLLSRDENLENRTNSVVSLFMTLLNANLTGRSLEALSSFIKETGATYNFEALWLELEQIMTDLTHDFRIRSLFSEINKEMQMINSVTLQNITLQLAPFLERLDSSSLKILEIIEDFLLAIKNRFHKYANKDDSKMIQTFLLTANQSLPDDTALWTKNIAAFLSHLENISREDNFDVALLTHLLNQEQPTNFSVVQLLLESFLINSINNLVESSQEAVLNVSDADLQIMNFINLPLNHTQSEDGERTPLPPRSLVDFMEQLWKTFFSFLVKAHSGNRVSLLLKDLRRNIIAEMSAVEACRIFQQPLKPLGASVTLQKVKLLVLRLLVIFAENPPLATDILCATLSCQQGRIRSLVLSALQGVILVHDHSQELEKTWAFPHQLSCEGLRRNLSSTLESFRSSLEKAREQGCECGRRPAPGPQRTRRLVQSLEKILVSGNPIVTFLSNFTVTEDVKVKDLMQNVTRVTEELRSSLGISAETIGSILEANLSHSKVLQSALTVALSGSCDQDSLRLLLELPEDGKSESATKELCGLPGATVYSLVVLMARNLDPRNFIYKTLLPSEARGLLSSLLHVISRLSRLLPKASYVLGHLPEFLQALKVTALLDVPDFEQASYSDQARSSAFGTFQSLMKMVCKEQASFFSRSDTFMNLPRVDELLEDDKEKFNIPEDSTPFCLKLYQEILRSPNGALVWSFLKPVLHGKILYTPNTQDINKVIQKANYTFDFVDKLKTLSETLLNMSSDFQSSGTSQMLNQLQEALKNKFVRRFVESQLHVSIDKLTENLQKLGGKLGRMFSHTSAGRVRSLGRVLVNLSSCVVLNRFQALESVATLESKAQELMRKNSFLASVIFSNSFVGKNLSSQPPPLPPEVAYTIRTSVLYSMRTDVVRNPFWKFHPQSLPADGFKYNYIFVPLQDMIERAIVSVQTGQEALGPGTQAQAIPYPCHTSDLFLNNVGFFFPLIMMLTWMVSVASTVRKLVYEREIQLEEYMRVMGVSPAVHFLAWLLENVAVLTVSSAALAVILKTSGIFRYSNGCIIFLFLLDFGVSVVMLSYFLSAFFSRANTAALCTSLVYTVSFLPYIVLLVLHNQLSAVMQTFLCLLSTTAFGQGVFFVTFLEGQEAGMQWDNMYESPEQAGMTFGWVCWMILFDSGLYFVCGWYLSNLIPGAFGLRKPWYFPFTSSYWKDVCGLVVKRPCSPGPNLFFFGENVDDKGSSLQNGEGRLEGPPPGVALLSVTKEHEHRQAAVRDLTLTFHRDQITALLGTNGAGKSTVISLLTGLYPPTSGTIIVNGKNLQTELEAVRAELGVCPQRDVLFDTLTVLEHLLLFASLKAPQGPQEELRRQVDRTLRDVGLVQHRHKPTRALSGGMKRKLSVGIAFLGASRTVVLDEPTSGVDPCSRRGIWDILLKYREGRTVIFSTHHLDEAEALSDRVAVLQRGRLLCWGPPSSLTQAHSQGLRLTLTRQPPVLEVDNLKDTACATSLIQTYIPRASLRGCSGGELSYVIPQDADRACFRGLFQALDQNLQHLHLTGYGISDTTLEEVFLNLLQDSKKPSEAAPRMDLEPPEPSPGHYGARARTPLVQGGPLLLAQMAALLVKRLRHAGRAWKGTVANLLLPVLFVALAMGLFMVRPLAVDYPPLKLTPGHYDGAETYFFSSEYDDLGLARVLLRKFGDASCADGNPDLDNSSCWRLDPSSHLEARKLCDCLTCPNGSTRAPYLTNGLGHRLLNLSGLRLEEYLLAPTEKPRLGGWSFGVRDPGQGQDAHSNISKPKPLAKVWYNQKGFHSLPSYLNHLNNLILWRFLPPGVDWRQYGITLYSHPYGGALLNEDKILESIRQCGVALCIVLGFSILSASVGSSVVRDRVTGVKRLQHISGLGYRTYWFTNFLFDMLLYLVSVCLCVAVIAAFQLTAFTFRQNLAATALLLALFGYASLPWMYLISRIFSSSDVAFISYISLNFIFGLCTMLMTVMPRLLAIVSKAQHLQNIYDALKWVFTVFPQFCLGQGLVQLCYNQIKYDLTHNFGVDSYVSPFEMNFLGWIFVQLAGQGTVLLLLRMLLHWDLWQRSRGHSAIQGTVTSSQDIDVEKEQMRVLKGRTSGDILVICNLSKSYTRFFKRTTAVQDISLGIRRGECFGLLGVNGAGKTTTFRMLNGDLRPTSGHAVIRTPMGEDVDLSLAGAAGVRIGYCPQQDALDELLTGWEHLHHYCSLRGIPKQCIPQVTADLVRRLHLEAHVDKPVAAYSGGTKRKLSTALALLGQPDLLFLDEPSSGMDPCSKRHLWDAVMKEVQEGCAVVLSSHSMDECEALCTRLAVVVDGSFRCLGSPQHIKNRFGDGYTVKIWLCKDANQHSAVSDCLKLYFPGIQFKGQHLNLLEYLVPKRWGCLADLFTVLETNKHSLRIEHYSVNQTTLEQVFINFATEQQSPPACPDLSADHHCPQHLPI
ncbi:ATP-binding cassette sub-family A member 13 isoform X2 [Sus scrofa]|nr:ATP-binding cassette sub-family A member 13 isoform X2 [Sus scrofa]XP_020919558.1 ATP-binding cassette sub-family A member 13 isoform X2 [Sus scrofa]XP_020919559.1 ATP-binding cassette sub-family A member 13 isoform X2 [Sus scrofa]XP_020919560.1 ATP-binding cassette sub-family A member 13 isoform X2 [Sus scrofa]